MKKPFSETKVGQFVDKIKPLVGNGLDFVGELTGNKAIEKIGEFLQDKKEQSPDMMAAHMEFEKYKLEWQLQIQNLEIEAMKTDAADRDSARNMRNEFTRRGKHDWLMYGTALFLLAAVGVMIYTGLFKELSDRQYETYCRLEGLLIGGALMMLFTFLWGTTRGSQRKTDVIDKMSNK